MTRVRSARENRISFIVSFHPANAYHPERCIFDTMKVLDDMTKPGLAEYEYFRGKSWHMATILKDYATTTKMESGEELADKLTAVAEELIRVANLLRGTTSDKIGYFAENGQASKWL